MDSWRREGLFTMPLPSQLVGFVRTLTLERNHLLRHVLNVTSGDAVYRRRWHLEFENAAECTFKPLNAH